MSGDLRMSGQFALIFWRAGAVPEMERTFYPTIESAREHADRVMKGNPGRCDFPFGYSLCVIVEEHLWHKSERCTKCNGRVTRESGRRHHALVTDAERCGGDPVKDSLECHEPED